MRRPLRAAVVVMVCAPGVPAAAEEAASVADCLPEDLPGGRDSGAAALRSGIPQLVTAALNDLWFAQDEPRFLPWKTALEGRAAADAREVWVAYLPWLAERGIEAAAFRGEATAWLEGQASLPAEESARLAAMLGGESRVLAERHAPAARAGNMHAIMALSTNPAGHELLLEMCRDGANPRLTALAQGAARSRSLAFRPTFETWLKSSDRQLRFHGMNGLLRLGDAKDLELGAAYIAAPTAIREFEVYEAIAWCADAKAAADVLLAEVPRTYGLTSQAIVDALSRLDDPRVPPKLRALRDDPAFHAAVCKALWRRGRAGDVAWLQEASAGEPEAAWTLRRLLGKAFPLVPEDRSAAVRAWLEAHPEEVKGDAALPLAK